MIYIPNYEDYSCLEVINGNIIRGYLSEPVLDTNVNYKDIYINSHYLEKPNTMLIESMPVCLSNETLTDDVFYRNDFSHILITFILLAFICFYLPTKLILRLFKKDSI